MAEAEQKGLNRPMSQDEERKITKTAMMLGVLALVFMAIMTLLVHFEAIKLHPSSVTAETIKGYAGRVEFTLRYQTLLITWLLFNILATIYGRIVNKAINPLYEESEQLVQAHKNILTNSYEQIVLSIFAQLIYVSFASPECILKTIPLVNLIQFVGRIAFFVGYPYKRGFGFSCTLLPSVCLILYNLYKFVSFLGLY